MTKEDLIQAVRFYEGDVNGNDILLGDKKAYVTLNALFFPGTENEEIKIRENKFLNPVFISRKTEVLSIIHNLFSAIHANPCKKEIVTYRVERLYDFELIRTEGHTIAFTSTSTNGFLHAYGDKEGIVLMKFHLVKGTKALNMNDFLPTYAKADEAEILLPPFLQLSITECEMTEQEKMIKDRNGNPPVGLFDIEITGFHVPSIMDTQDYDEKKAISFLNKLNTKKPALPEERQAYLSYKQEMMDSIIHDYEHQFLSKPVK